MNTSTLAQPNTKAVFIARDVKQSNMHFSHRSNKKVDVSTCAWAHVRVARGDK